LLIIIFLNENFKGRSFWQVSIPQNASWCWRKIIKLRDIARGFIRYKVGDGRKIFLWYDNWHPAGCLINVYEQITVYDAGHGIGPKLDSIIKNGFGYWPSARSDAIVAIQSRLPEVELGGLDQAIWDSKSGQFSNAETWDKLRIRYPVVDWYNIVWFASAILRHAFFFWLAFHKAITTREKMCG
jgi:hypothetical protein